MAERVALGVAVGIPPAAAFMGDDDDLAGAATVFRASPRAFDELEQEQHVLVGWEAVIIYFGLDDLIPLVKQAHAVQRIRDRTIDDFRKQCAYARAHPDQPIKGDAIVPFKGLWPEVDWGVANREIP